MTSKKDDFKRLIYMRSGGSCSTNEMEIHVKIPPKGTKPKCQWVVERL